MINKSLLYCVTEDSNGKGDTVKTVKQDKSDVNDLSSITENGKDNIKTLQSQRNFQYKT